MNDSRRSRGEKPQSGNPHQLSRRLHVYPAKSIERFVQDGGVDLLDTVRNVRRRAPADDVQFSADRSWNHSAESGYMKKIEDAFQALTTQILRGRDTFDDQGDDVIAEFYGLWLARSNRRHLPTQYLPLGDDVVGMRVNYSKDDVERLEKHDITALRSDRTMAMRDVTALHIRLDIDTTRASCRGRGWGVLVARHGEFCVPDAPSLGVIPLTPTMVLALENYSDVLTSDEVAVINGSLFSNVRDYLFARDLAACPGLPVVRA